jgi:hypothetical protein
LAAKAGTTNATIIVAATTALNFILSPPPFSAGQLLAGFLHRSDAGMNRR